MKILADANLLLRSAQPEHPQHEVARNALSQLHSHGHELVIVPQVIYEFWVVATRPVEVNGLGFPAEQRKPRLPLTLNSMLCIRTMSCSSTLGEFS